MEIRLSLYSIEEVSPHVSRSVDRTLLAFFRVQARSTRVHHEHLACEPWTHCEAPHIMGSRTGFSAVLIAGLCSIVFVASRDHEAEGGSRLPAAA